MFRDLKKSHLILILIIYSVFGFISINVHNIHFDEREFHLPTLELFYNSNPITAIKSAEYKSENTPLPYIIVSLPLKIFHITPTLTMARLFNILISLIVLFIFIQLCDGKKNNLIIPALILLFYPYFLKPSFVFFMSIYGLIFFLLFIYLIEKKTSINSLLSGFSLAAAILCQQFYLIVFVFYIGYWLYKEYLTESGPKSILDLFYFLLPFVLPLIVFLLWSGLTPPGLRFRNVEFSFESFTGVLVTLGSMLFPYMIFNIKEIKVRGLITILFLSVLLVLFAFPVWVNQPTVGGISGLTFNFLDKVNDYNGLVSFILKSLFCFLGMGSFIIFFKKADDKKSWFLLLLYVVLAIGFSLNRLPSERHMLPLITIAYLFIFNRVNKKFIYKYWLAYQVIIGGVYFYYIMFAYKIQ